MKKHTHRRRTHISSRKFWLLLGAMAGLGLPLAGHAVTFTVNDGQDLVDTSPGDGTCKTSAGSCTLRAAIQETNVIPGADTINLNNPVTLTLTGPFEDLGKTGDLDISDDLTIEGNNYAVDGNHIDRVFHLHNSAQVTLKNITIKRGMLYITTQTVNNITTTYVNNIPFNNGLPKGEIYGGGGILADDSSTLVLENATVSDNFVSGESSYILTGGGLYINEKANATISTSTISANTGPGGGGLTNLGRTEIRDTTINNNDGSASNGGGIRNMGGYLHVGNVTLTNNKANMGGGIASSDLGQNFGNVIISNTKISYNSASQFGGGIHNESPVTLTNSTVSNNTSSGGRGGGIYNSALGNMDLINSTISQNEAATFGSSGGSGGGVYNTRAMTFTNVTVYNNKSTPCTGSGCSSQGGVGGNEIAIYAGDSGSSPSITLTNTLIADGSISRFDTTPCSGSSGYTSIIQSLGGNLEQSDTSGGSCGLAPARTNNPDFIINTTTQVLDPTLAVDPSYPDTTPVLPLVTGSPAIDKGISSLCPQVDQRFLARDGACDIGAYEFGATQSQQNNTVDLRLQISDSIDPAKPGQTLTYKILLSNLYANASAQGVNLEIKIPPTLFAVYSSGGVTTNSTTVSPSCDQAPDKDGYLRCYLETLPGLGQVEVFVNGQPTAAADGQTITVEAGVTSSTQDAFIGNNHVSEDTSVDSTASNVINYNPTYVSGSGGGGGTLNPWWLLPLGGLLLARRQRRH